MVKKKRERMAKKYPLSLFIFRRDLRIQDNTALRAALDRSLHVIPCFIFNPEQIGKENSFRSVKAVQFMVNSLRELAQELAAHKGHLYLLYGYPHEILEQLFIAYPVRAAFVNKDYTPYSTHRDSMLKEVCARHGVDFISLDDALLHAPLQVTTATGKPYEIFTPFFKKSSTLAVQAPIDTVKHRYYCQKIKGEIDLASAENMLELSSSTIGGRTQGLSILAHISQFKNYALTHDFPAKATTLLSPPQ